MKQRKERGARSEREEKEKEKEKGKGKREGKDQAGKIGLGLLPPA
jgi:hypothetical protein